MVRYDTDITWIVVRLLVFKKNSPLTFSHSDTAAEAFGATEDDIAAPMHGRNKPIALGQVGIRCMHCKRKSLVAIPVLAIQLDCSLRY